MDLIIEKEFKNLMQDHYFISIEYDDKKKYKNLIEMIS